jgi:SWI/SNF-related matrix-associated actin-dependent regulator 1 of chromatin subfamily A
MLDAMELELAPAVCGRIDGSMSVVQRQRVVDDLQSGMLEVVVLSMGAAGVGLTLTGACTAIFLEIPWSPAVLKQSEDRLHRIGQEKECSIYYILCNDTLDTYVWRTIHRKENVAARLGL